MTLHQLDLSDVTKPLAEARGLPNEFYTSPEIFELEKQKVFFPGWAAIGFTSDVPVAGYAKPMTFLGQPLLLVRDHQGEVRVFQNVCRHRGMILVEEAGPIQKTIRCPYHSWCYELNGQLRTTPHVGGPGTNRHEKIKREELGLLEVRSHIWMGMVFVNLDGKAAPFEVHNAQILERYKEFTADLHVCGPESHLTIEVNANWKLAIENGAEAYHLPWVHPGLNSYSRLEDHYNIEAPGKFCGQGSTVYSPMLSPDGRQFPDFEGLGPKWDTGSEYPMYFPNAMIGFHRNQFWGFIVEPVAHNRSIEHVQIFYADPDCAGEEWREMRETNASNWREIFAEDIFVVEGMQKGRSASMFDGGKFSPAMDGPTHCFHDFIARSIQS